MTKRFGVMLDMSRNGVMRPQEVKKLATILKKMGYNMLQLYTEDTYEIPEEPYFGYLRGRYSREELKDIVSYCNGIGMEVIPCIQTLAHLNQAFLWKPYRAIRDVDDILMVGEQRTYELIENMFRTLRECFTSNVVNIGMDEAELLGRGKYYEKHGPENRFEILHGHLLRVIEIAKKYGFRPVMWSDMFFKLAAGTYRIDDPTLITEEVVAACPPGVDIVYWDYYSDDKNRYDCMLDAHAKFKCETWFAGGIWTWKGFASNNTWTIQSMAPAMASCREHGVENILMTVWGNYGALCSYYAVLPSYYAVRRMYDGVTDIEQIKKEFGELFEEDYDDMLLLDIPVDYGYTNNNSIAHHTYLLFSDPFLGFLDPCVKVSHRAEYEALAERLDAAGQRSANLAYLFENAAALCRALACKHDLGVRTRAAYASGDKKALACIAEDYTETISRIEAFEKKFRRAWHLEKKPHGYDVSDLRFGGLLQRLKACHQRLLAYLNGEEESIPELLEELLPYAGTSSGASKGDMPDFHNWLAGVTPNRLFEA